MVQSEEQSLRNEITNKSGDLDGQTSQNGRDDLGKSFKSNKKGKIKTYILKFTKNSDSTST
jgi:hypothetical protein